ADREAVGGVLHVAAAHDRTTLEQPCGADGEARVRSVGLLPRSMRRIEKPLPHCRCDAGHGGVTAPSLLAPRARRSTRVGPHTNTPTRSICPEKIHSSRLGFAFQRSITEQAVASTGISGPPGIR